MLLWDRTRLWRIRGIGAPPSLVCAALVRNVLTATIDRASPTVCILDSELRAVIQEDRGGRCRVAYRLPSILGTLRGAVWLGDALVVVGIQDSVGLFIGIADGTGRPVRRIPLPILARPWSYDWLYVSRTDKGAVVGSRLFPAWWLLIDSGGHVLVQSRGLSDPALAALTLPVTHPSYFVSPLLRSGDAFIQSVTNLATREHHLVVYDAHGVGQRFTRMGARLAIIYSPPGDSLYVGITREGSSALLVYARVRTP